MVFNFLFLRTYFLFVDPILDVFELESPGSCHFKAGQFPLLGESVYRLFVHRQKGCHFMDGHGWLYLLVH